MEKIGIIDLGSNSARLVIVELFGEGHFMVVDELKESVRLAMDGVPAGIHVETIREHLLEDPNVEAIHHLHIWPISTTENALTAHVVLRDAGEWEETRKRLHEELAEHGIGHATLETESPTAQCPDKQKE